MLPELQTLHFLSFCGTDLYHPASISIGNIPNLSWEKYDLSFTFRLSFKYSSVDGSFLKTYKNEALVYLQPALSTML